jgi:predicted aspartyl protease
MRLFLPMALTVLTAALAVAAPARADALGDHRRQCEAIAVPTLRKGCFDALKDMGRFSIAPPAALSTDVAAAVTRQNPGPSHVQLQRRRGILVAPVLVNDRVTLDFIVDSGAADVSLPAGVMQALIRAGTISEADFLGTETFQFGDGKSMSSKTYRIRSLKVGDKVVENVTASVAPTDSSLLLGQTFLSRFKSWSIDNRRQLLVLD